MTCLGITVDIACVIRRCESKIFSRGISKNRPKKALIGTLWKDLPIKLCFFGAGFPLEIIILAALEKL